jgi:hypothetical protein
LTFEGEAFLPVRPIGDGLTDMDLGIIGSIIENTKRNDGLNQE